jgi:hypothetical protein
VTPHFDGRVFWVNPGGNNVGVDAAPVALVAGDECDAGDEVATTVADEDGYFGAWFIPAAVGTYQVQAVYAGRTSGNGNDQILGSTSECVELVVTAPSEDCPAAPAWAADILDEHGITGRAKGEAQNAVAAETGVNGEFGNDPCAYDREAVEAWLADHGYLN